MRARITLVMAVVLLGAGSVALASSSAVGTWHANAGGQQLTLILSADGSGSLNGERGQWRQQGNQVALYDPEGNALAAGQLSGDTLTFYVEGTQLVFTRAAAKPTTGGGKGDTFDPKLVPGKTVKPKDSSASFRVPRGWKHGYEQTPQGETAYVLKPAKGGDKGAVFMTYTVLSAADRRRPVHELLQESALQLTGGVALETVEGPAKLTINGAPAARWVVRARAGGQHLEGYFAGVIVEDYAYVIVGLYDVALAEELRPGIDTVLATFKAKPPKRNDKLERQIVGCWSKYSGNTDNLGSTSSESRWGFKPDGTYWYKGFTSVSVDGASALSESEEAGTFRIVGNTLTTSPNQGEPGRYTVALRGGMLLMGSSKYIPCN